MSTRLGTIMDGRSDEHARELIETMRRHVGDKWKGTRSLGYDAYGFGGMGVDTRRQALSALSVLLVWGEVDRRIDRDGNYEWRRGDGATWPEKTARPGLYLHGVRTTPYDHSTYLVGARCVVVDLDGAQHDGTLESWADTHNVTEPAHALLIVDGERRRIDYRR